MRISNWITFETNEKGSDRTEEMDSIAQRDLAKEIQTRLRSQADPGIDLKSARKAQSIRVRAEGGQIIVDEDDQGKILTGGQEQDENDAEPPASNLEDLFRPGSGVPEMVSRPDGSTQLVFRSIKAADLFGQQIESRKTEMVERTVSDVFRTRLVESFDEASNELGRLYPELNKK